MPGCLRHIKNSGQRTREIFYTNHQTSDRLSVTITDGFHLLVLFLQGSGPRLHFLIFAREGAISFSTSRLITVSEISSAFSHAISTGRDGNGYFMMPAAVFS